VSTLAPVKPSQEILDGLSLDAAWERAKDLEVEVRRLRAMLKVNSEQFEAVATAYHKMERGITDILRSPASATLNGVMAGLKELLDKAE
jgi:hypothetical protein